MLLTARNGKRKMSPLFTISFQIVEKENKKEVQNHYELKEDLNSVLSYLGFKGV